MSKGTAALLAQVQKWGVPIRYQCSERNKIVFAPDEPTTRLFIVQEGCLRLYRHGRSGKEVVVRWCGKGDLLGEEAVTGKVYRSFAHATPAKVAQIPARNFCNSSNAQKLERSFSRHWQKLWRKERR